MEKISDTEFKETIIPASYEKVQTLDDLYAELKSAQEGLANNQAGVINCKQWIAKLNAKISDVEDLGVMKAEDLVVVEQPISDVPVDNIE